jgi:hypothetical protein
MAKFVIDDDELGWSVEIKQGDGFEKVYNVTATLLSYTYDEIVFDMFNLKLYIMYTLIAIIGACLVVSACKLICLCDSTRRAQNRLIQEKTLSSNKRKNE